MNVKTCKIDLPKSCALTRISTLASNAIIFCWICACSSANFSTFFISVSLATNNSTSCVWSALDIFRCFGAFEFSMSSLFRGRKSKAISCCNPLTKNHNWIHYFAIISMSSTMESKRSFVLIWADIFLVFNLILESIKINENIKIEAQMLRFVFVAAFDGMTFTFVTASLSRAVWSWPHIVDTRRTIFTYTKQQQQKQQHSLYQ